MCISIRSQRVALFLISFLSTPFLVKATYSILATDASTKQIGGAGATCITAIQNFDVYTALYRASPGRSILHTQGLLLESDDPILAKAKIMMQSGVSPEETLSTMVDMDKLTIYIDASTKYETADLRQYVMADFSSSKAYSGESLGALWNYFGYADGEIADIGKQNFEDRYTYHAAGNVVKKGTVLSLQSGFEDENDEYGFGQCDMAGKLMTAMYRVATGGFGDMRCLDDGTSAAGAYIHIDNEDGTVFIHINEVDTDEKDPVEVLGDKFKEWRKSNPCQEVEEPSTCKDSSYRFKIETENYSIWRDW